MITRVQRQQQTNQTFGMKFNEPLREVILGYGDTFTKKQCQKLRLLSDTNKHLSIGIQKIDNHNILVLKSDELAVNHPPLETLNQNEITDLTKKVIDEPVLPLGFFKASETKKLVEKVLSLNPRKIQKLAEKHLDDKRVRKLLELKNLLKPESNPLGTTFDSELKQIVISAAEKDQLSAEQYKNIKKILTDGNTHLTLKIENKIDNEHIDQSICDLKEMLKDGPETNNIELTPKTALVLENTLNERKTLHKAESSSLISKSTSLNTLVQNIDSKSQRRSSDAYKRISSVLIENYEEFMRNVLKITPKNIQNAKTANQDKSLGLMQDKLATVKKLLQG